MNYPQQILDKARPLRLLILDVDGVLTDGRLYYSESGEESKSFSTQDVTTATCVWINQIRCLTNAIASFSAAF